MDYIDYLDIYDTKEFYLSLKEIYDQMNSVINNKEQNESNKIEQINIYKEQISYLTENFYAHIFYIKSLNIDKKRKRIIHKVDSCDDLMLF